MFLGGDIRVTHRYESYVTKAYLPAGALGCSISLAYQAADASHPRGLIFGCLWCSGGPSGEAFPVEEPPDVIGPLTVTLKRL